MQKLNIICISPSCEQHTHNIPIELTIKYVITTAIILCGTILVLLFLGYMKIIKHVKVEGISNQFYKLESA